MYSVAYKITLPLPLLLPVMLSWVLINFQARWRDWGKSEQINLIVILTFSIFCQLKYPATFYELQSVIPGTSSAVPSGVFVSFHSTRIYLVQNANLASVSKLSFRNVILSSHFSRYDLTKSEREKEISFPIFFPSCLVNQRSL